MDEDSNIDSGGYLEARYWPFFHLRVNQGSFYCSMGWMRAIRRHGDVQ